MNVYKCHKCLLYTCEKINDEYYCNSCDNSFTKTSKKSNKSKTLNNKKIHLNNVMKDISKKNDINNIVKGVKDSIDKNNIDEIYINQSLISNILKKNFSRFKDYKMVFSILNIIENNKKDLSFTIKNDIEILFLSYVDFLSKKKKLDSISYNLILGNIFRLFNINENFKPNVKDDKETLWNIFVYTITNEYFYGNLEETNPNKYYNYYPKVITKSLGYNHDYCIS